MDARTIEEGGGEGALAAYTEVFAITLDEIKQAIDEFPLLFDIDHCPPNYLRVIAELLNYPWKIQTLQLNSESSLSLLSSGISQRVANGHSWQSCMLSGSMPRSFHCGRKTMKFSPIRSLVSQKAMTPLTIFLC